MARLATTSTVSLARGHKWSRGGDMTIHAQGYRMQEINPESDLYKSGARFAYIIPDGLWMHMQKSENGAYITNNAGIEFENHVNTFYDHAKKIPQKLRG